MTILKLALIVIFLWFTSPASTHFLGQIEYYTNRRIDEYAPSLTKESGEEET